MSLKTGIDINRAMGRLAGLALWAAVLAPGLLGAAGPVPYASRPVQGKVVDSASGRPLADAVVSAVWELQPAAGDSGRRYLFVQQAATDGAGRYILPGWGLELFAPAGWELVPGRDPLLRAYAEGYRHAQQERSDHADAERQPEAVRLAPTLGLTPIGGSTPEERERSGREELARWRAHLDAGAEALVWTGNPLLGYTSQWALLERLDRQCQRLQPAARQGLCFAPESVAGRLLAERRWSPTPE